MVDSSKISGQQSVCRWRCEKIGVRGRLNTTDLRPTEDSLTPPAQVPVSTAKQPDITDLAPQLTCVGQPGFFQSHMDWTDLYEEHPRLTGPYTITPKQIFQGPALNFSSTQGIFRAPLHPDSYTASNHKIYPTLQTSSQMRKNKTIFSKRGGNI